jgi:transcriptional regulator with XRE-family HTH domain
MASVKSTYKFTRLDSPEDFLNALRERLELRSDYQVAIRLGVSHQAVTRYRKGDTGFDETIAGRVADLLDVTHAYVMAKMEEHRARTEAARGAWAEAAEQLRLAGIKAKKTGFRVLAAFAIGAGASSAPPPASAAPSSAQGVQSVCIMSTRRRRNLGFALQAFLARLAGVAL